METDTAGCAVYRGSLEKPASDETTPNVCVHVCQLAFGGVKREVTAYTALVAIMAIVRAVARHLSHRSSINTLFLVRSVDTIEHAFLAC